MSKSKDRKTISELLVELNKAKIGTAPVKKYEGDPGARVLNALQNGEALAVLKPMSFDGKNLVPGDELAPDKAWWPRVAKLAEHGFVVPAGEHALGLSYDRIVNFMQTYVDPAKAEYTFRKNASDRAHAEVILAERHLKDAQTKLQDAMTLEADAEQKLRDILIGEEASKLLA